MERNKQIQTQLVSLPIGSTQTHRVLGKVVGAYASPDPYSFHVIIEPDYPQYETEIISVFPSMMIPSDFELVQIIPQQQPSMLPVLVYARKVPN